MAAKYAAAMKRIDDLEKGCAVPVPDTIPSTVYVQSEKAPTVSPPLSPRETLSMLDDIPESSLYQQSMISRPTAD
jgi:hypothetical protein